MIVIEERMRERKEKREAGEERGRRRERQEKREAGEERGKIRDKRLRKVPVG